MPYTIHLFYYSILMPLQGKKNTNPILLPWECVKVTLHNFAAIHLKFSSFHKAIHYNCISGGLPFVHRINSNLKYVVVYSNQIFCCVLFLKRDMKTSLFKVYNFYQYVNYR